MNSQNQLYIVDKQQMLKDAKNFILFALFAGIVFRGILTLSFFFESDYIWNLSFMEIFVISSFLWAPFAGISFAFLVLERNNRFKFNFHEPLPQKLKNLSIVAIIINLMPFVVFLFQILNLFITN